MDIRYKKQDYQHSPEQATLKQILYMRPLHPLNIKRADNIRLLIVRIVTEIDVTKELDKNRGEARVSDKGEAQEK